MNLFLHKNLASFVINRGSLFFKHRAIFCANSFEFFFVRLHCSMENAVKQDYTFRMDSTGSILTDGGKNVTMPITWEMRRAH